jgi:hypothetical protein
MNKQKQEQLIQYLVLVAAGYFLVINPILKKLGIKKDIIETLPDTSKPSNNVWAGAAFLKNLKRPYPILKDLFVEALALRIFNALPTWGKDDDQAIVGVFRSDLQTKSQVAYLADYFKRKYGYDLYSFLQKGRTKDFWWSSTTSGMSSSELKKVLTLVNAKPIK